ncbi:MAG: transposase [Bryobacterales bacterium]|nr:transposase [Bryobacterales bacterium]
MSRTKRLVVTGCPHHVTQRGNYRQNVFFSEQDRAIYLNLLARYSADFDPQILGFCLMTNHVHLIVVPQRPNSVARAIGRTHNDFSRWLHIKQGKAGHLWQNRFYSCPLDPAHLAQAMLYVELNPVRAEITASPVDYPWSSARTHCGLESPPAWLDTAQWSARYPSQKWQEVLALGFAQSGDLDRLREATRNRRPFGTPDFIAELEAKTQQHLRPSKRGRPRKLHALAA